MRKMKGFTLNMRLLVAVIALLIGIAIIVVIVWKVLAPESFSDAGYEVCLLVLSRLKFLGFSPEMAGICETFKT